MIKFTYNKNILTGISFGYAFLHTSLKTTKTIKCKISPEYFRKYNTWRDKMNFHNIRRIL